MFSFWFCYLIKEFLFWIFLCVKYFRHFTFYLLQTKCGVMTINCNVHLQTKLDTSPERTEINLLCSTKRICTLRWSCDIANHLYSTNGDLVVQFLSFSSLTNSVDYNRATCISVLNSSLPDFCPDSETLEEHSTFVSVYNPFNGNACKWLKLIKASLNRLLPEATKCYNLLKSEIKNRIPFEGSIEDVGIKDVFDFQHVQTNDQFINMFKWWIFKRIHF